MLCPECNSTDIMECWHGNQNMVYECGDCGEVFPPISAQDQIKGLRNLLNAAHKNNAWQKITEEHKDGEYRLLSFGYGYYKFMAFNKNRNAWVDWPDGDVDYDLREEPMYCLDLPTLPEV